MKGNYASTEDSIQHYDEVFHNLSLHRMYQCVVAILHRSAQMKPTVTIVRDRYTRFCLIKLCYDCVMTGAYQLCFALAVEAKSGFGECTPGLRVSGKHSDPKFEAL